jgi:hypothetical protein
MTRTMLLTCPECGSMNVVQYSSAFPGVLECQDCRWTWQEEAMPTPGHRSHKVKETERSKEK